MKLSPRMEQTPCWRSGAALPPIFGTQPCATPQLTALGLELQADVANLARENVAAWNLTSRVTIEVGDIMLRRPELRGWWQWRERERWRRGYARQRRAEKLLRLNAHAVEDRTRGWW